MTAGSQCIGPREPAFIMAMIVALLVSVVVGMVLARWERTRPTLAGRVVRNVAWFGALLVSFAGSIGLTGLFNWILHPERQLCTSLVWRWFFVPPLVAFITGVVLGAREQSRQRRLTGEAGR